jgi:teichuronopeptide biosynthesis TupA-like protein
MSLYISALVEEYIKRFMPHNDLGDWIVALTNFYRCHGRLPRDEGGEFNDALYWLKVSGQLKDPARVRTTDKALLKEYVREHLGDEYNVPMIAVLDTPAETRAFSYPADCVIKPTHMSGEIIMRTMGSPIDFDKIDTWFKTNYYCHKWGWREQNYKALQPRVIVEPLIFGRRSVEDYKVFCVSGAPKAIQVDLDRSTHHTRCLYALTWEMLPYSLCYPIGRGVDRPKNLDEMLRVSSRLASAFNFVRVDLYTDGQKVYVGELTHCHGNAQEHILPSYREADFAEVLFGPGGFRRQLRARS